MPPEVVEFTVDGDERPSAVNSARALMLRVRATDDGEVVSATFQRGGDVVAEGEPLGGGVFEVEWIVSGAEQNDSDPLEVVVLDDDGLEASASLSLVVEMPNGGLIEEWTFDSGFLGTAYGISPEADGEDVIWVGQRSLSGVGSNARFARADGGWVDTVSDDAGFASDVVRQGAASVSAISLGFGVEQTSALRYFDASGNEASTVVLQGAPGPSVANYPLGLEQDGEGRLYLLSSYTSGDPVLSSFLMRLGNGGEPEWSRDVTGSPQTDGAPFVYDFDVSPEGRIAVVGASGAQGWIAVYDADGGLLDQSVMGDFSESVLYDVSWGRPGELVVAGTSNDGGGWARLLRQYSDDLIPGWEDSGGANTSFTQAVGADHLGRLVSVSTEACDFNEAIAAFQSCRLVVRKYGADGGVLWQELAEGGNQEFNGPVLVLPGFKADVEFDRFGYVYFSAQHNFQEGGGSSRSEWWMQKHHP